MPPKIWPDDGDASNDVSLNLGDEICFAGGLRFVKWSPDAKNSGLSSQNIKLTWATAHVALSESKCLPDSKSARRSDRIRSSGSNFVHGRDGPSIMLVMATGRC
jgi:hypothetical protein